MANMTGIASMLAQGGAQIGQQIGSPITAFGQGLGGMLTARKEKQREEEKAREIQNLLQQNANNPAALEQMAQGYDARGETELAETFRRAAQASKTRSAQETLAGAVTGIQQRDPASLFHLK
jgi:surfactin synthase thioesterase subunit